MRSRGFAKAAAFAKKGEQSEAGQGSQPRVGLGQIDYIGNTIEYTWEEARKNILEHEHWGPWGLETESGL